MVKSSNAFIEEIELLCKEKNISYMEALMLYIEKYKVEPETVASIVKKNTNFKSKLYQECTQLKLVL